MHIMSKVDTYLCLGEDMAELLVADFEEWWFMLAFVHED
jgi:hypothetical protein